MDNDLEFDYLTEELPGFSDDLPQGPAQAQDLMSTLEADYLENELPIDEEGKLVRQFEREGEDDTAISTDLEDDGMSSESLSELVDSALAEAYPEAYSETEAQDVGLEALDPDTLEPDVADDAPALELDLADSEQDLLLVEEQSAAQAKAEKGEAEKAKGEKPKAKKSKAKSTKSAKRSKMTASRTKAAAAVASASSAATQHLQRSFDATDLVTAKEKLEGILGVADIPLSTLLGLAAERCSGYLPDCANVTLTTWQEEGEEPVPVWTLPKNLTLRQALDGSASPSANAKSPGLFVSDLSGLELEHIALSYEGLWLSLLRLNPDPLQAERSQGLLSLSGEVGLRSGATFLKAVALRLESPISLAV